MLLSSKLSICICEWVLKVAFRKYQKIFIILFQFLKTFLFDLLSVGEEPSTGYTKFISMLAIFISYMLGGRKWSSCSYHLLFIIYKKIKILFNLFVVVHLVLLSFVLVDLHVVYIYVCHKEPLLNLLVPTDVWCAYL